MDNKITPEVIERFLNNQCDEQEARQLADYLKNVPQEVLNRYLADNDWQNIDPTNRLPEDLRNQMWADLAQKTGLYKKRKVIYLKRVLMAACMLGFLWTGYYLYSIRTATNTATLKQQKVAIVKISKQNTTDADQTIKLPDGTELLLKPGASVSYFSSFKKNRELFLAGTAFFSVIHDSVHPFVVKTNGIATTDLGTKFWIENKEKANTITVKLVAGKVLVQSTEKNFGMTDLYLKPGQKVVINKSTGEVLVSDIEKRTLSTAATAVKKVPATGNTIWTNAAYTFSKTSLEEVFKKLEIRYKVTIKIEDPEINQHQFTGKIMYSDSLVPLMNIICSINNLSYVKRGDTLYIKK